VAKLIQNGRELAAARVEHRKTLERRFPELAACACVPSGDPIDPPMPRDFRALDE